MERESGLPVAVFRDYWDRLSTLEGVREYKEHFSPRVWHLMLRDPSDKGKALIIETHRSPEAAASGGAEVYRFLTHWGWELLGKPDYRQR